MCVCVCTFFGFDTIFSPFFPFFSSRPGKNKKTLKKIQRSELYLYKLHYHYFFFSLPIHPV